jgi:hypothetical protein
MARKLFADSNRASLREIIEDNNDWGTTPAAGVSRARRFTQSSIVVSKTTAESAEIRDDRMVSSIIETAASSGGEIQWEFAAGSQDGDFQRVLMSYWSRPMGFDVFRGQVVSIVANNQFAISGADDLSPYFTASRRVKLAGFVNPANNDYLQISGVAFAGGVTTVTVTATTLVAEAGTAFTTVYDANDVVLLKSTAIRFGNTAKTIDSNGANAFAAAIAAKQLVPGQRIFVEGVGYEAGTITLDTVLDGETVTISDGVNTFAFEAQSDSDIADADAFTFAIGVDDTATAVNLAAKINAIRVTGDLNVSATSALGVVTVTNLNKDGGSISTTDADITVVDFANGDATLGGFYTIVSLTDDKIVVDRDVPVLAAGKHVTIKGSMIRNPGSSADITPQSFSLETGFHDVSQYFKADGLRAGTLALDVSSGAIITGSTTTMGRDTTRANTEVLAGAGYTPIDAAATENISATANVGQLSVNGASLSTAIQSIKFSIEGNLREQRAVGSKFPEGIAAGRLKITGTIAAYFADGTLFDKFLAHETTSLSFPFVDPDKNTYYFTIPAFKITSDPISPGGLDQDVMENMQFSAFRDVATKCMIQIDRFSSTAPVTAL